MECASNAAIHKMYIALIRCKNVSFFTVISNLLNDFLHNVPKLEPLSLIETCDDALAIEKKRVQQMTVACYHPLMLTCSPHRFPSLSSIDLKHFDCLIAGERQRKISRL